MEIKINGYIVKNVTDNNLTGWDLSGFNSPYYLNEDEKHYNKKMLPKFYFDEKGANKAISYEQKFTGDEYKIIPVEVIYNIKEDEVE